MRVLRASRLVVLILGIALTLMGCDTFPTRGKIGALTPKPGGVTVLWGNCPGEHVTSVELGLTDRKHSKTLRILWAIEAESQTASATSFTAGTTPAGYREVVPFAGALVDKRPHERRGD